MNIDAVVDMVRNAGAIVADVEKSGVVDVSYKEDATPVTLADRASHEYIVGKLMERDPAGNIVSEEAEALPWDTRKGWKRFWLIDPLDGTKGFIDGSGEYAINVALVEEGEPVVGAIHSPVRNDTYFAVKGKGAYLKRGDDKPRRISCAVWHEGEEMLVVTSKHHRGEAEEKFLAKLREDGRKVTACACGSALKFCAVAEGKAHIYARHGPTSEWDTAAGHIIVEEAGGVVVGMRDLKPLTYNKRILRNDPFVVCAAGNFQDGIQKGSVS